MSTRLPEVQAYLNNYIIPIPVDFSGQLYIRKVGQFKYSKRNYQLKFGINLQNGISQSSELLLSDASNWTSCEIKIFGKFL